MDDGGYEGRMEPDCTTCDDRGMVLVDVAGNVRGVWEEDTGPLTETNCPDCNPTAEQSAARSAEIAAAVAAGEIDPEADPWS